jgi:pyridoxine/pyridoxamine 5'-phosphate oxidase
MLLHEHNVALLATTDWDGRPHARWLSPAILGDRPGALYAVTLPSYSKVTQVRAQPCVEWLVQKPDLTEVITIRGRINVIDNPSLRTEVLDAIGPRLWSLWKLAGKASELVVLETVIEEAIHYLPLEGRTSTARYASGGC